MASYFYLTIIFLLRSCSIMILLSERCPTTSVLYLERAEWVRLEMTKNGFSSQCQRWSLASQSPEAIFIVPDWGIYLGLAYRLGSLCRLAERYDKPMPELTLSPPVRDYEFGYSFIRRVGVFRKVLRNQLLNRLLRRAHFSRAKLINNTMNSHTNPKVLDLFYQKVFSFQPALKKSVSACWRRFFFPRRLVHFFYFIILYSVYS